MLTPGLEPFDRQFRTGKKLLGKHVIVVTRAKRFSVLTRQFRFGVHHFDTAAALIGWRLKHNRIAKLRSKIRRVGRRPAERILRRGISSLTEELAHLIFVGKEFGLVQPDARQPKFFAEICNGWYSKIGLVCDDAVRLVLPRELQVLLLVAHIGYQSDIRVTKA